MAEHGYTAYTKGCRCGVCRAAKRDYQRAKRQAAWAALEAAVVHDRLPGRGLPRVGLVRYVAPGVKHGTATAYNESACRCWPCTDAASAKNLAEKRRHRARRKATNG